MRKQFSFGQTVSISFYSLGSSDDLYTFEVRNGRKIEMVKVASKKHVAALLNNGFHGSALHFHGIDTKTQKFFKRCSGIR